MMAPQAVPQAGALVVRVRGQTVEVLLVRARKDPSAWVFPKGHLEAGESHAAAALREAREEAGVDGIAAGLLGTLAFDSGSERVNVEYYLVRMIAERSSPEGREKRWVSIAEAATLITFDDARRLLGRAGEYMAATHPADEQSVSDADFMQFVLHEYDHLADSLLANEDSGERRVAFFLTLCGLAGAGIGFFLQDADSLSAAHHILVVGVLTLLTLLGYGVLLRVITRNAVSDRYRNQLARLRQRFVNNSTDSRLAYLPFDPFAFTPGRQVKGGFGRGGWEQLMSLILSFLCGTLAGFSTWWTVDELSEVSDTKALLVGVATALPIALLTWAGLVRRRQRVYDAEFVGRDGTVRLKPRPREAPQ